MGASPELKAMVRGQIARQARSRRLLGAFLRVDRRLFVPPEHTRLAYHDGPVALGFGQTVSQPAMVAEMLEALEVHRGQKVLEVGAGSGYALALLAALGARVFGLDRIPELLGPIPARFRALRLPAPALRCADGAEGWPEEAPFDRILVSAACPEIPGPLLDQLAPGGLLAAPVGDRHTQWLTVLRRSGRGVEARRSTACVFVPLLGPYGFGA